MQEGGLVFYGGFLGATATALLYARQAYAALLPTLTRLWVRPAA